MFVGFSNGFVFRNKGVYVLKSNIKAFSVKKKAFRFC